MGITEEKIKKLQQKQLDWLKKQHKGPIGHQHEWIPAEKKDGSGKTIYGYKCRCRQARYTDYH